jgi:antitoxin Phd
MKNNEWQLQEAKNKFSEVIQHALAEGPQEITRHGEKTAVILSFQDFIKLKKKKDDLATFFQKSPLKGMIFERQKDFPRMIDL